MTDDQMVALMKRKLGVSDPDALVVVPLLPLFRFVSTAYRTVGVLEAIALLSEEKGRTLRLEAERLERVLSVNLSDIVS